MAINLWAAAGKPTAYSPLPITTVPVTLQVFKEYVITFKAKSASRAKLDVLSYNNVNDLRQTIQLSIEFNFYRFEWKETEGGAFWFNDLDDIGDIIIENITLVEKPIPPIRKPKKNLLPPFSQWALHANAKVVAPYELELNATGVNQYTTVSIPVLPSKVYTFTLEGSGTGARFDIDQKDKNGAVVVSGAPNSQPAEGAQVLTFTTDINASGIIIAVYSSATGKFTFKNPMLTEGTTAQPFEPFVPVNSRAVKPVVGGKNIFNGLMERGYWYSNAVNNNATTHVRTKDLIPVKPSTPYTWTRADGLPLGDSTLSYYDVNKNLISAKYDIHGTSVKVTLPANTAYVSFHAQGNDLSIKFQLEEGTTATPFEPYREVNKRAGLVPAKNLFRGERTQDNTRVNEGAGATIIENVWDNGKLKVANGSSNTQGRGQSIPVKIGKTYTLRAKASNAIDGAVARIIVGATDVGNEYNTSFRPLETPSMTFVATSEKVWLRFLRNGVVSTTDPVYFWDIQLEEGTTATPYEPYKPINPPAPKGIIMDGVTNYVQLPSMTMDSVEIDCLIDNSKTSAYIFDARPEVTGGFYWVSGSSAQATGGFNREVNGVLNGDFISNSRMKIKLTSINGAFTKALKLFSNETGLSNAKGVIYGVKCYLNGQVVAQYDFTTENTKAMNVLMGTKTWRHKLAKR